MNLPEYLSVNREQFGADTAVKVRIGGSMEDLAHDMANDMFESIVASRDQGHPLTMIGPVDQSPILARTINERQIDCGNVCIINMDEYLNGNDDWLDIDHPLSFRGYMNRKFYHLLDEKLAPTAENRVFPDPADLTAIQAKIDRRGVST